MSQIRRVATVTFFSVGDWVDARNGGAAREFKRSRNMEGPYRVVGATMVPNLHCTCRATDVFSHTERCLLISGDRVGHPQWVAVATADGAIVHEFGTVEKVASFSGAWFRKVPAPAAAT